MKKKLPETSIEAYKSLDLNEINERYRLILGALATLGSATTEEIAAFLKVGHGKIWRRVSELNRMELIYRPGIKKQLQSGRLGYVWSLTNSATPKTESQEKLLKGKSISEYSKSISKLSQEVRQESLFD